jgi:hypothetical protein
MDGWFVEKLDRIAYTLFAFLLPSAHFSSQRDLHQTVKLVPQPQEAVALGLLTLKA